jgi:hypothetical protein
MLGEHEATASRHLTRIRAEVRADVEARLARDHGMDAAAIAACFQSVTADAGSMDLADLFGIPPSRKAEPAGRSKREI